MLSVRVQGLPKITSAAYLGMCEHFPFWRDAETKEQVSKVPLKKQLSNLNIKQEIICIPGRRRGRKVPLVFPPFLPEETCVFLSLKTMKK
jgi:hypothetical protein